MNQATSGGLHMVCSDPVLPFFMRHCYSLNCFHNAIDVIANQYYVCKSNGKQMEELLHPQLHCKTVRSDGTIELSGLRVEPLPKLALLNTLSEARKHLENATA